MTGSRRFIDRILSPSSWLVSVSRHFLYGLTIIRHDGLLYFLRRSSQFIYLQVNTAFQSVYLQIATRGASRSIKIDDLPRFTGPVPDMADESSAFPTVHGKLFWHAISAHNLHVEERQALREQGHQYYAGRRVLFVSPIRVSGGGANLIFLAVKAMRHMGVDVNIMNLNIHRSWFERHIPDHQGTVIFGDIKDIPKLTQNYDAVIATSNPTVSWIAPAAEKLHALIVGYYIQDYEPYFYPESSHEFRKAIASYTLLPNMVRMVTTPWIAEQIERHHHAESNIIGAHLDTDLFRLHPNIDPSWPDRPLRITAMIRPSTIRRNPKMTMAILKHVSKIYGPRMEIRLFGCDLTDPGFASLEKDFPWQLAGQLRSAQVAYLFNEADIFVDYSEFQALGLTALEGMAMGLSVIVPTNGGTNVYAQHEENCLVVDSHNQQTSSAALQRLIEDDALRLRLQIKAISTAASFFPELATLNMLRALFPENK